VEVFVVVMRSPRYSEYNDAPRKHRRHKYPTQAQLERLNDSEGPHAAAAAEAGGNLLHARFRPLEMPGRGCGSPTGVVGTSGKAPCGVMITDLAGNRLEHLCPYCSEKSDKSDALK